MDFPVSFVAFTLCIAFLSFAEANDCVTRIQSTNEFMECMTSYSTYMANADFTTGENPMCSAEGMAKTECFKPFLANCSQLVDVKEYSALKPFATENGIQEICNNAVDGSNGMMGNPACLAASKCMEGMNSIGDQAGSSNADDKFGIKIFQTQSTMMCGPLKEMFDCIDKIEGECPAMTDSMDTNLAQNMPGMNLANMKSFIKDYCSSLPSDFGTNKCVTERLENVMTDECVQNATKDIETPSCSDFKNFFACMPLSKCGAKYDQALKKVASYFVSMMGSAKCDLNETSNSNTIRVSTLTIVSAILMVFKLI